MNIQESNVLDVLSGQLKKVQDSVIGVFCPKFYPSDKWICVIDYDNGNLTCIEIGGLLGLQTLHIHMSQGVFKRFYDVTTPLGKMKPLTLTELMTNPIDLDEWWKENCK